MKTAHFSSSLLTVVPMPPRRNTTNTPRRHPLLTLPPTGWEKHPHRILHIPPFLASPTRPVEFSPPTDSVVCTRIGRTSPFLPTHADQIFGISTVLEVKAALGSWWPAMSITSHTLAFVLPSPNLLRFCRKLLDAGPVPHTRLLGPQARLNLHPQHLGLNPGNTPHRNSKHRILVFRWLEGENNWIKRSIVSCRPVMNGGGRGGGLKCIS